MELRDDGYLAILQLGNAFCRSAMFLTTDEIYQSEARSNTERFQFDAHLPAVEDSDCRE